MYRAEGREMDSEPPFRFVTGSLHVDFLKPTPLGGELEIRGRVKEVKGRKVIVEATVYAEGVATARGEVVAVQMPETFLRGQEIHPT
jgi:acyl-CoA thioesterase FadM